MAQFSFSKTLRQVLCVLWATLSLPSAYANPTFTVCSHTLPPHTYASPNGEASGFASEVLLAVAKDLGWILEISYYPWVRARIETETGRCDMLYTILKRPDYEEFALFPAQYLANRFNVLLVRKNSGIHYGGDLEAFMRQYVVGLYRDKAVSPLFDKLKTEPWARIESPTNADSVMKMLLAKRFDAAIENSATAFFELKQLGRLDEVEILKPALLVTPAYIAFSKKGKAVAHIARFDEALKNFKASKAYQKLLDRYADNGVQ